MTVLAATTVYAWEAWLKLLLVPVRFQNPAFHRLPARGTNLQIRPPRSVIDLRNHDGMQDHVMAFLDKHMERNP